MSSRTVSPRAVVALTATEADLVEDIAHEISYSVLNNGGDHQSAKSLREFATELQAAAALLDAASERQLDLPAEFLRPALRACRKDLQAELRDERANAARIRSGEARRAFEESDVEVNPAELRVLEDSHDLRAGELREQLATLDQLLTKIDTPTQGPTS